MSLESPGRVTQRRRALTPGLQNFRGCWENFRGDIAGGLSVAAIALPVGIAYADLAGVPTAVGIFSAIIPLFAYAFFGSSRQLIVGPDTATCLIVATSLGPLAGGDPTRYLALLSLLTLMTALILIAGGIARLGFMANFLSQPILTGYLNGVAILIIVGQLPKFLGVTIDADGVFEELVVTVQRFSDANLATLGLGGALISVLLAMRKLLPAFPAPLLAVVGGYFANAIFDLGGNGVAVLGEISLRASLPALPRVDLRLLGQLFIDASGIALVAFTSGVLTAKSFAQRNRYRVDSNREFFGFGVGTLASWACGGFPVTGASSRTTVANAAGGKTQLVGITAGGTMLLAIFLIRDGLELVPLVALAAVVLFAAIGLLDIKELRRLYQMSRREFYISIAATIGVLLFGVLNGVLLAVALSLLWMLAVMSRPKTTVLATLPNQRGFYSIAEHPEAETIPGLLIFRFEGNLIFFNADYFSDSLEAAIDTSREPIEWVVIDASPINILDATALRRFDTLREELEERGIRLMIARVKPSLQSYFSRGYSEDRMNRYFEYRFRTMGDAVRAFRESGTEQSPDADAEISSGEG